MFRDLVNPRLYIFYLWILLHKESALSSRNCRLVLGKEAGDLGNFCIKKSPYLCQLWLAWGANLIWSVVEGWKDFFERFIHIVEQQMTFLQYFFVKQTILCLEFGICVLVKHCKSEFLPLYLCVPSSCKLLWTIMWLLLFVCSRMSFLNSDQCLRLLK